MSINIHFKAERKVQVIATGKIETQTVKLSVWQTPTDVTEKIIKSADPLEAYLEWVLRVSVDYQLPVFAPDDIFGERDPIRYETENPGKDHVKALRENVKALQRQGYEIIASAW